MLRRVVKALAAPLTTVGRVLKGVALDRLKNVQPAEPMHRNRWGRRGELINVNTKQRVCLKLVVFRSKISDDRNLNCSSGAAYEKAHVTIKDATRLTIVELLRNEKLATGDLSTARCGLMGQKGISCRRVHSNSGSAYHSKHGRENAQRLVLHKNAQNRTSHRPMT